MDGVLTRCDNSGGRRHAHKKGGGAPARHRLTAFLASGLALATAASLAFATAEPPMARADARFIVRAVGDSVAAGFGLGGEKNKQLARCAHQMPTTRCDHPGEAYGAIFARRLNSRDTEGLPVQFANAAVSGAEPDHFLPGGRFASRLRVGVISPDPDVVTVSVGANDVLSDTPCALRRKCVKERLLSQQTQQHVQELLQILTNDTSAEIYLVLYPNTDADIAGAVKLLNATLRAAAAPLQDVIVVTPHSFRGHSCTANKHDRWMLGFTKDFCLHPNDRGVRMIADSLIRVYRAQG